MQAEPPGTCGWIWRANLLPFVETSLILSVPVRQEALIAGVEAPIAERQLVHFV